MIAEASPQGYNTAGLTRSCIFNKAPQASSASTIWNEWYAPFFAFIAANQDVIRAVAYINTNWDSQPLWACNGVVGQAGCANGYWGDTRVQGNATIRSNFISQINQRIYVNGSTDNPPSTTTPTRVSGQPTATPTHVPTATPTAGGAIGVPGVVTFNAGSLTNGGSRSWTLSVSQAGNYKVLITSSSSQSSQLINVALNGSSLDQAIDAGQTIPVYFSNVGAGSRVLTITARSSAVVLGRIEVQGF